MEIKAIDGKLLKGTDIKIDDIVIKNYNLGYIFDDEEGIGLSKYYKALQPAVIKLRDFNLEEILGDDMPKGMMVFDVFCMFEDVNEMFINFLNTFTDHKWSFNRDFNEFVVYLEDKTLRVNRANAEDVLKIVRKMYNVGSQSGKEEQTFRSKEAEEAMREFEEWEETLPSKNGTITLEGIIEGITTKGTYTLFNIWDLTVYQLMRTFYKINDAEHIDNLTKGVYAGTVDGKALEGLHWAKRTDS